MNNYILMSLFLGGGNKLCLINKTNKCYNNIVNKAIFKTHFTNRLALFCI